VDASAKEIVRKVTDEKENFFETTPVNSFIDLLSLFKYVDDGAPCNRKHLPDGTPS
jgi:hypothetical protein